MKFFRMYLITVMIFASITAFTASVFIADERARKITLGEKSAVVVIGNREKLAENGEIDILPILEKIKQQIKKAAGFAPPPIDDKNFISENQRF